MIKNSQLNIFEFTLLELLLVIVTIMILVSILLPAFSSVREKGRATVCQNNLRQFGLLSSYYVSDYNEYIVPCAYKGFWWIQLSDFYQVNAKILRCPVEAMCMYLSGNVANGPKGGTNYRYNSYLGSEWYMNTYNIPLMKLTNLNKPQRMMTLIDGAYSDSPGTIGFANLYAYASLSGGGQLNDYSVVAVSTFYATRHKGKINYLFLGGNVAGGRPRITGIYQGWGPSWEPWR